MLIASAKSQSARGTSQQPTFMSSCLIISHTCLPCLPSGRTLLFWSGLFVVAGGVVSWEKWESSELERCMRVVRFQVGKDGRVMRWQGGKGGRVVRWQGQRLLVLFEGGRHRVGPRFRFFVSDINQRNEGPGCVQDILAWPREWKDSP